MKVLILLLFFILNLIAYSQNQNIIEPSYPGGFSSMMSYINKNLKYPNEDVLNNVEGIVEVAFWVEKDGTITNIRIVKGLTETLNAEALRVISILPKWIPGMVNGEKLKQEVTLKVTFSLG